MICKISGRGMPRPVAEYNGMLRPIPWSQGESWGIVNEKRQAIAWKQSRCLVCGETVQEGIVFVRTNKACSQEPPYNGSDAIKDEYDINDLTADAVGIISRVVEGPLHTKCGLITRSHCIPLRNRLRNHRYAERPYKKGRYKSGNRPESIYV